MWDLNLFFGLTSEFACGWFCGSHVHYYSPLPVQCHKQREIFLMTSTDDHKLVAMLVDYIDLCRQCKGPDNCNEHGFSHEIRE